MQILLLDTGTQTIGIGVINRDDLSILALWKATAKQWGTRRKLLCLHLTISGTLLNGEYSFPPRGDVASE